MTEEGKSSMWSFEQATNVIGDVFLQLAQQNAIAQLGKYATNAKRAGLEAKMIAEHGDAYLATYGTS